MPLLKLWNTLRGRRSAPAAKTAEARTSAADRSLAAEPTAEAGTPAVAKPAASRGVLGLGRRGPHAGLCKLVRPLRVTTVLEISVGDGSRAAAVLQTLAKAEPEAPLRYIAVDQFELGGGPVTLKQFHQRLRKENIRPQVFPDPVDRALLRVAHTVGAVDLVLIADATADWQEPQRRALLSRVTHRDSVILRLHGEDWRREAASDQSPAAAAARAAA